MKPVGKLPAVWRILLILLPLAVGGIALCIGRIPLSPAKVFAAVCARFTGVIPDKQAYLVVWNLRLPRILLAMLVGSGLSAAGCAFQSLFANPLATPDTVGVASGSSFGAALGILMGFGLIGTQLTSLCGGLLAVGLTLLAGTGKGRGKNSIVLAGIIIGSLFSALVALVKYLADADTKLPAITYWLMGNLDAASYPQLALGAPLILIGIIGLYLLRWRMNLLPLSDDEVKASGVSIRWLRGAVLLLSSMITASCISMCGQVGWIGLIVPHLCRLKFGSNHLSVLPASIGIGAAFLVIVDTIARSATAASIPISILTAIIGAPFFLLLMRRSGIGGSLQ